MPIDCHRGAGVVASVLLGLGGNEPPSLRGKHCDLYDWDAVWDWPEGPCGCEIGLHICLSFSGCDTCSCSLSVRGCVSSAFIPA